MQSRSFRTPSGGSTSRVKSDKGLARAESPPELLTAEDAESAETQKDWLRVLCALCGERLFGPLPNRANDRRQLRGSIDEEFVAAEAVPLEPVAESVAGQADARAGST
jgi:hypothetical protein